jgi:hypothetical protein
VAAADRVNRMSVQVSICVAADALEAPIIAIR